eukprot:COSAG06_NODE_41601_length_389_cov_1.786207_1_plen_23_part_01
MLCYAMLCDIDLDDQMSGYTILN